ncbi:MAG: DUF3971 domain-containing protein, partial [Thioalkalispiraceae bacterium]
VIGVDLGVVRKTDGNFSIQGLDIDQLGGQISLSGNTDGSDELATWFFKRSKLAIKDSRVVFKNNLRPKSKPIKFDNVNFYLRNDGTRHQLSGVVTLPKELGRDLQVDFDFNGNILNPSEWYGKVYTQANDLNLVNWGIKPQFMHASLEKGTLGVRLWGDWRAGIITSFSADVNGNDFVVNVGDKDKPLKVNKLSGLVDWHTDNSGWKLNVKHFQYQGKNELWPESSIEVRYLKEKERISAHSSFLRLDDIKQVLINGKVLDGTLLKSLKTINPSGDLYSVYLDYSFLEPYDKYSFSSEFKGLTIRPWGKFPGIENITGNVWADETQGRLQLASDKSQLKIPNLFRETMQLSSVYGEVDWYNLGGAWHVNADNITADSPDINASLGFYAMIPQDGSSPYLDLQVKYDSGDARQTYKYLPVSIMSKNLLSWLDNAFKSGEVTSGGVIFNGRLKDFPYRDRSGTLLADFHAKNVELDYQPGWPNLEVQDADLEITGLGLSVISSKSKLYNSILSDAKVTVDSFDAPVIHASAKYHGQTRDLAKFLVESPISPEAKTILDQSRILGKATGSGMLQLPLSDSIKARSPLYYQANISLSKNELNAWRGTLVTKKVSGNIKISPEGIFSDNIRFELLGGHSKAKLYTTTINNLQNIRLSMSGEINTEKLSDHVKLSMLKKIKGETQWQGVVALGNQENPGYFQFYSRMAGVELKLPAPLQKTADSEKTLSITAGFPEKEVLPLNIQYGNELSMALAVNLKNPQKKPLKKGEIIFSTAKEDIKSNSRRPQLPKKDELLISGRLLDFHVDDWLKLINQDVDKSHIGLTSLNIPVRLDMDYLKVSTNDDEQGESERKDPRKIALFDGDIRSLLINDKNLGHVKFKMVRHPDGLSVKDLVIDAPYMHVQGEASWLLRDGKHVTNLLVQASTDDLGNMLAKLGFSAVMQRGKTKAVIQAHWFDTPDNFGVEKLNGSLGVIIDDGVLSDVKPGAGRMLGLLSVAELPRRLLLDFSELKQGFAFKQIIAQIDIRDGDAYADTLKIISPIALITIEGRTGLATRDFNQHVIVVPSVSGTLPVISWLAWGGQIGALTFLFDQLFGDQFDSSIATEYEITGSWDDPQIRKIEKSPPDESQNEDSDEIGAD